MSPVSPGIDTARLAGAVQLGARWAELLGALALYPDTSLRVTDALARFRAAFATLLAASGPEGVRLLFEGEVATFGAERVEVKHGSKLRWLKDRFDAALLAGVRLCPEVEDQALVGLSRRLIEIHGRRLRPGTGFDELWGLALPGIELHERRFDGGFVVHSRAGPAAEAPLGPDELAGVLSRDEGVQSALRELARLGEHAVALADRPRAIFRPMELIEGVARLLPPEVAADPGRAVELARRTLLHLGGGSESGDASLLELAERVGQQFFGRVEGAPATPASAPAAPAEAPRAPVAREERPEDQGLREDTAGFEQELAALPRGPERVEARAVDLVSEQLGVYLHQLAHAEDPRELPGLEPGLLGLLERREPAALALLRDFVRARDPLARRGARRLLGLLRRGGNTGPLRECGALDAAWALEEFPHEFFDYVAGLDLEQERGRHVLVELCDRIGARAFAEASELLGRDRRLLERGFTRCVFADRSGATLPLARLILSKGGEAYKGPLVDCLRQADRLGLDGEVLELVQRPEWLSTEYLLLVAGREEGEKLDYQRQAILCRFLRATEAHPGLQGERLRAVELLGRQPSLLAQKHLERLVGERRLGLFARHPRDLRAQARAALARIREAVGEVDDV